MARIGEIRSMVGIDTAKSSSVTPATTSTVAPTTAASANSSELATAFSTELSTAVAAGDSGKINTLVQSLSKASSTSSVAPTPATPAPVAPAPAAAAEAPAAEKVTPPKTNEVATGSGAGAKVVAEAKQYLGVPYVWGGTNPRIGLDCSGLVQLVMKDLGYKMPRVARDQAKVGTEISSLSKAQPGDLLGMRNGSHIAIYLGNNKILHAPQPGSNVSIRALNSRDDIDTIRRVVRPDAPAQASTVSGTSAAMTQYHQALSAVNALSSKSGQLVSA